MPPAPADDPVGDQTVEDAVDALEDGDRTIRAGPARAALRHRVFRRVFIGAFLSNIGSWMQNVVLGAFAYDLTGSPAFVGILLFAQLGPLLLFSLVGGLLADVFDRRRLLVTVSLLQGLLSLGLACVALDESPSKASLVAHRVPHRHGPGGVRPDLQRAAPRPRRPRGPRRAPSP